jgi:hypothetical protein
MAQVLGAASASTKITAVSMTVAKITAPLPKLLSTRMATTEAITRCASSINSSTGLRKRSGCSTRRPSCFAHRRPSSSRLSASTLLTRVRAVSAIARKEATIVATTITTISQKSDELMRGGSGRATHARAAP